MEEPLYTTIRPKSLDEIVEQEHVVTLIRAFLERSYLPSMIFYGPPGTGKTTVARIAAQLFDAKMYSFSAVRDSTKEIKTRVSRETNTVIAQRQIVFVDEVHRYNKAQQDIFLPMIENDGVVFIGATTENPSFYVNNALMSRCRPLRFTGLTQTGVAVVLRRGAEHIGRTLPDEVTELVARAAEGDTRVALSILETAHFISGAGPINRQTLEQVLVNPARYDKKDDAHYRIISAFIKSLRGSDPDAALYYMVKMITSGEDPLFLLRRMVIFASEDVGNADPRALSVAVNGLSGFEHTGMPEGEIIMAQVATYLATAPKSNASYKALGRAKSFFKEHPALDPPSSIINATSLGPGEHKSDYKYPHDYPGHWVPQRYFPDGVEPQRFYELSNVGYESKLREFRQRITNGKDD